MSVSGSDAHGSADVAHGVSLLAVSVGAAAPLGSVSRDGGWTVWVDVQEPPLVASQSEKTMPARREQGSSMARMCKMSLRVPVAPDHGRSTCCRASSGENGIEPQGTHQCGTRGCMHGARKAENHCRSGLSRRLRGHLSWGAGGVGDGGQDWAQATHPSVGLGHMGWLCCALVRLGDHGMKIRMQR